MSPPCLSKPMVLLLMLLVPLASSFSIIQPFSQPHNELDWTQQPQRRLADRPAGRSSVTRAAGAVASRVRIHAQRQPLEDVRIREATPDEAGAARQVLLKHAMNPLFVSGRYLLVATMRPTKSDSTTTGGDGAGKGEEDKGEEEKEEGRVVGFGQIRPLPQEEKDDGSASASFWELASLFVDPDHRRKGVGTAIIQELLRQHDEAQQQQQQQGDSHPEAIVLLLTLAPTAPLYEPHGFQVVDPASSEFRNLPKSVRLEHAAGKAVSWVLGNELVCMVRRRR